MRTIQIDTREHARAITKIIAEFDQRGVRHISSKLYVGDYMDLDNPRIIIDRKQSLLEVCSNVTQQHERFRAELVRARDAGITLVILVEEGHGIGTLEDVRDWKNPRRAVRWKTVDGKRVSYQASAKAVEGAQLYKSMKTIKERYGARWEFCKKAETGARILEILERV